MVYRSTTLSILFACCCVALLATTQASAATLLLDHFGVSPKVKPITFEYASGQFYTAYAFDHDYFVPQGSVSADYMVADWFGRWTNTLSQGVTYNQPPYNTTMPAGEEPYDVEAMYFDNDEDNLYFAIITSFPSPENGIFQESRLSNLGVVSGDLAIDLGLSGSQTDGNGFNYNYGINLTNDQRPSSGNASLRAPGVGNTLYQTTAGWYVGTPNNSVNPMGWNAFTNFDPLHTSFQGTSLGSTTVSWYKLDLYYDGMLVQENRNDTWVIEVTVPRSLLPTLGEGDRVGFQWLMGCRNDGNNTAAYISGDGEVRTPEPGTWALMALGAAVLGARRRRQGSGGNTSNGT